MKIEEIKKFISEEHKFQLSKMHHSVNKNQRTLMRTVKLSEEVGELGEKVLHLLGQQRDEKVEKKDLKNIEEEIADVIICAMYLAKNIDVDFDLALERKVKVLESRRKK